MYKNRKVRCDRMFNYVSLALVAITAVIVLINLVKGLIRGFKKSIGSLIAIILSIVISAIVTSLICNPGSGLISWLMDLIKGLIGQAQFEELLTIAELGETVTYYIAMVAAPFVFFALYSVISIILSIVVGIVIKLIPPYIKKKGLLYRLGGVGVGMVCGILVSAILLIPVVGVLNIAINVERSGVLDAEDGSESILSEYLEGADEDKIYAVYSSTAGKAFDYLASADYDGEKIYLKEEVEVIIVVLDNIGVMSGEIADFGDEEISALNSVVDNLNKSALIKTTLAGFLSAMASKWIVGEPFLGIEAIDAGELLNPLINSIFDVLSTSTKATITEDMRTLVGMLGVMAEYELLKNVEDFEKMLEILSAEPETEDDESAIEALINVANANPRMTKLSDEITMLSIRALASTLGIPESDDALYNDLMDEIASVLNNSRGEADRKTYVEENVLKALDTYGVNVSGDAAVNIADTLLADFENVENVNGTAVKEFFMMYVVASGKSSDEGELSVGYVRLSADDSEVTVDPATGAVMMGDYVFEYYNAESYNSSAAYTAGADGIDFGDASSLYSSASMKSNIITLTDVFGADGVSKFSQLDVEEAKAEAKKMSEMLALAGSMFEDGFSNIDYNTIVKDMGAVLDKMAEMKVFGSEATAKLLEAIFQNEDVKGSLGLPMDQIEKCVNDIIQSAKNGNSYESITKSVGSMVQMMQSVSNKEVSSEEKIESTKQLMKDITPENAELLGSMATPEMMKDFVADEEKAETVSDSVSSLFTYMADLDTDDEEVYKNESEAVNTMLNLAMDGAKSSEDSIFSSKDEDGNVTSQGKIDTDATEFVDLIVSSSVVSQTINDTVASGTENPYGINPSEEDAQVLTDALLGHYDGVKGDLSTEELAELIETLENIAKLTNIDIPEFN